MKIVQLSSLCLQLGYPSSLPDIRKRLNEINQHSENCAFAAVIEERVVGWIHAFYTVRIESAAFIEIED